jgi:hypothetical protein
MLSRLNSFSARHEQDEPEEVLLLGGRHVGEEINVFKAMGADEA